MMWEFILDKLIYVPFVLMMGVCIFIGVYFAVVYPHNDVDTAVGPVDMVAASGAPCTANMVHWAGGAYEAMHSEVDKDLILQRYEQKKKEEKEEREESNECYHHGLFFW